MLHSNIFKAFLALVGCVLSAYANTEIINIDASYSDSIALPETAGWPTFSPTSSEYLWEILPAPLYAPLSDVCEGISEFSCPHEIWASLDLDSPAWSRFHKFTLRISWPASSPADFSIELFNPIDLERRLRSSDSPDRPSEHRTSRLKYARIRLVDTGVRSPSSLQEAVPAVPFFALVEPLYFGVLPASVIPVLLFLLVIIGFASVVLVPPIHDFLAAAASKAREELKQERKED